MAGTPSPFTLILKIAVKFCGTKQPHEDWTENKGPGATEKQMLWQEDRL